LRRHEVHRARVRQADDVYMKREHWISSTDFYKRTYLRLDKCARLVNGLAGKGEVDLLDIGCGPATLSTLLHPNIHYHGIDIAIHDPSADLIELDVTTEEIRFRDRRFDLVVAAGLFEYLGNFQRQKLREIQRLVKENGKFIVTYTNFAHVHPPDVEPVYNNVVTIPEFRSDLERFFQVERCFPSSHNWIRREPNRLWLYRLNMAISAEIPYVTHRFANSYFFVCSPMSKSPGQVA